MSDRRRQEDRSAATRAALLGAGRSLFGELGYSETSREAIVARAGVTRGALHHHFGAKKDLFRAVHEAAEQEIAERIANAALAKTDGLERLEAGCREFVDATADDDLQRITLLDGPSVLGWEECRTIDAKYGFGLLVMGVQGAMDVGVIARQPVTPLASFLLGGLIETAMRVAREPDVEQARIDAAATIGHLLRGISPRAGADHPR